MTEEKLILTDEWDKTFPKDDRIEHRKITFHNRYGMTLAADRYKPIGATEKLAALAVCGHFGAVKVPVPGKYAHEMAARVCPLLHRRERRTAGVLGTS